MGWFKKIEFWGIVGTVRIRIPEEDDAMVRCVLEACSYYGFLTPEAFQDQFGLPTSITRKLLDHLTDNLGLLIRITSEPNNPRYELINSEAWIPSNGPLNIPLITHFGICLTPLFLTDRYLPYERLSEDDTVHIGEILQGLSNLHEIMNDMNSQSAYNIPPSFVGLDTIQGVKLLGKVQCQLVWNSGTSTFTLINRHREFGNLLNSHPIVNSLRAELTAVQNDTNRIHNIITNNLSDQFNHPFTLGQISDDGEIEIILSDSDDIGTLYHIYRQWEHKSIEIDLSNDWYFNSQLKIMFASSITKAWIDFMNGILDAITTNQFSLFELDPHQLFSEIEQIQLNIAPSLGIVTESQFKDILDEICSSNQSMNNWLFILKAKFWEGMVFE